MEGLCDEFNCVLPQIIYVQILTPVPVNVNFFWKSGLCGCNQGKIMPYGIRVGPSPMTGNVMRRGKLGHRDTNTEKAASKHRMEAEVGVMYLHAR